ncbi:MAG: hypothetical protein P4M14_01755 [Gammaproteobacteria bacterium]|nr:hypothetical protein [Gammaproteobacteria bacterium]
MEYKPTSQSIRKRCIKVISAIFLLLPITASAHLISITATKPFPATVAAFSSTSATFTVTNMTTKVSVTVIDQSSFPSGLSISSSTCGNLLAPGQSCTIQLVLNAESTGKTISTALKEWAKPSADAVQYPINITVTSGIPSLTLVPVNSSKLPALRDPVVAKNASNWLIVSGSLIAFHDFTNVFNSDIYVYNPVTTQIDSVNISSTNLPVAVQNQLASSDPEFLQDGDTLYIIGGFYNVPNTATFITLNTITAINVPGMIRAVMNHETNLAPYVNYNTSIPEFQVTGGQLGKIGNYFYLAYGQRCEGFYCGTLQAYTNTIYQFSADPSLSSITIVNSVRHNALDGSGWRRRDYSLAPFKLGNTDTLFALGGPFTPGNFALVWTNGINFNSNLQSNDNFINQQANQYLSPHLSMYSANSNTSYVASFSGLSNLYWGANGLVFDNTTPYGNVMDLISADASGNVQEYANLQPLCSGQPLASCLYMGLSAEFIQAPSQNYDNRFILQLDQLPQTTPTLVGYIYGGLLSPSQTIFGTNQSYVTNQVYAVYVVPTGSNTVSWKNITNLYPGN